MNRTIDLAADWIGRLEAAGFGIVTQTESYLTEDYIRVHASHASGEEVVFGLSVLGERPLTEYEWSTPNMDSVIHFDEMLRRDANAPVWSYDVDDARATSKQYVADWLVSDAIRDAVSA